MALSILTIKAAAGLLGALLVAATARAGEDFAIGGDRIKSGDTASGYLAVPAKDGVGAEIPYTVVHGAKRGPVLALVAGVHAYDYLSEK